MKITIAACLVIMTPLLAAAQEINAAGFRFLHYGTQLPQNLLSTKTAVLLSVPKASAAKAHPAFRKMGIDAAAYYYIDDITSGKDAALAFSAQLKKRDFKNLILISQGASKTAGKPAESAVIVITAFNGEPSLISNGQEAWANHSGDLSEVLQTLGRDVYRDKQAKTNFLINDVPEFFDYADIIKGKRIAAYAKDLKVDKLAVPQSPAIPIPEKIPDGVLNEQAEREIKEHNQQAEANNAKLDSIMKSYPLQYGLVDNLTEEQMQHEGYLYVLLKLHTTGIVIRRLLEFDLDPNETAYITVKREPGGGISSKSLAVNAPVYKFYVKHLHSKDVYVGKWDADETWEAALSNFIAGLKNALTLK